MYKVIEAIDNPYEELFEMANIVPKKSGLKADIWSDHKGVLRNKKDNDRRVKISYTTDYSVSVSIEENPVILSVSSSLKKKNSGSPEWEEINKAIKYVGRNYDIFLKHYNGTDDSFDDEDLYNALRERGEYK